MISKLWLVKVYELKANIAFFHLQLSYYSINWNIGVSSWTICRLTIWQRCIVVGALGVGMCVKTAVIDFVRYQVREVNVRPLFHLKWFDEVSRNVKFFNAKVI